MRFSIKLSLFFVVLISVFVGACKKDSTDEANAAESFDREVMLSNMANNLIVPSYRVFEKSIQDLDTALIAFTQNSDLSHLLTLQEKFKVAYKAWEYCCSYEFGPAEQYYLTRSINTFPTDVTQITTNISTGTYDLNAVMNMDAKGLPALDYLLFGIGADNDAILLKYNSDADTMKRKQYLLNVSTDMKSRISAVYGAWKNGYLQEFINNTGTDIGSSTSYLYNEFLKSYEGIKNYKFSIPLGRMSGQTSTEPEKVEAFYSGISSELAKDHWISVKNIWEGRGIDGEDGIGFQEYLAAVEGGETLITQTRQQQTNVERAFTNLPAGKLSDAINQQFTQVDAVNTELQKLTRFYKSDLSSLLGIAITFSSGDGD